MIIPQGFKALHGLQTSSLNALNLLGFGLFLIMLDPSSASFAKDSATSALKITRMAVQGSDLTQRTQRFTQRNAEFERADRDFAQLQGS